MPSVADYFYECIYSAGILAGSFIAGYFTAERRFEKTWGLMLSWILSSLAGGCFSFLSVLIQASGFSTFAIQFLHLLWYVCWLIALFFVMMLNYKGTAQQLIFTFVFGLLMDTSVFGFFRLSYDFGWLVLRENTWYSVLAEILFMCLCYIAYFFVFKKVFKEKNLSSDHISFTIAYILTIVLSMFMRMSLQNVYEYVYQTSTGWIVNFSIGFISIIVLILILLLYSYAVASNEKDVLAGMLDEKERQYLLSAESIDTINQKCHDIKRLLRAFEFASDEDKEKVKAEMERSISVYDSSFNTSSPALNTILSEKSLYCQSRNIQLSCSADGDLLSFIDPVDIYILFSNILDNATEAVSNVEENRKVITISVTSKAGYLLIREDNYFSDEIKLVNGIPQTTKREKKYHGYGAKSIRHISEKYGGDVSFQTEDHIFTILISIPLPNND